MRRELGHQPCIESEEPKSIFAINAPERRARTKGCRPIQALPLSRGFLGVVSPAHSIKFFQLNGRLGPVGAQVYRSPVGKFRLRQLPSDLVEMPELQRKIGIIWGELLCLAVVMLGTD